MPDIKPYQAQESAQVTMGGRRAQASDFFTGDAKAGEGTAELGAALYDYAERGEVTDARAKLAKARADWTVHLQERAQAAPAGDLGFASKFNEDFGKYLQDTGASYTTRAGREAYERGASELSSHFVQAAGTYQARSIGDKLRQDYGELVNKSAMAVYNDPTQFDSTLRSLKEALQDDRMGFGQLGSQRDELFLDAKQRAAVAAVQGTINLNPELAQKQLAEGKWDDLVPVGKRDALNSEIKTAIDAQRFESERLQRADEKARLEKQRAVSAAITDQIILGKATAKDIVKADLPGEEKRALFSFMDAQSRETDDDKRRYGPGFVETLNRIYDADPNNNPTDRDILLRVGNDLTMAGAQQLRTELLGRRSIAGDTEARMKDSFLKGALQQIEKSNAFAMRDSKGNMLYAQYLQYALPEYHRLRETGKSPAEILAPDGPLASAISRYQRTPQQIIEDLRTDNQAEDVFRGINAPPEPERKSFWDDVGDSVNEVLGIQKKPSTPDQPIPVANIHRATRTATRDADGATVYEIDGRWVDAYGRAVRGGEASKPIARTPGAYDHKTGNGALSALLTGKITIEEAREALKDHDGVKPEIDLRKAKLSSYSAMSKRRIFYLDDKWVYGDGRPVPFWITPNREDTERDVRNLRLKLDPLAPPGTSAPVR